MGKEHVTEAEPEKRERRRRAAERRPADSVGLLPAEDFSDEYAELGLYFDGPRGPDSPAIEDLLAGSCAGWPRRPDAAEFYEAMKAANPNRRQQAISAVLICEGTIDRVFTAWLQQAFTWRQLARAMHRLGIYSGQLAAYVNGQRLMDGEKTTPARDRIPTEAIP